jgi:hypothetical protein
MDEDDIERQLIFDTNYECCSGDEVNGWDYEYEDDEDLVQLSLSSSSSLWSWRPPQQLGRRGANNTRISGGAVGININEAPHVNKDSTPLCVFMVFFAGIIHLLVEETNRYYHQYLASLEDGSSPLPDMTDSEMSIFLRIIIQIGHDIRDRLRDYWTTAHQLLRSFYSNTLQHDRFLRILRFTEHCRNWQTSL